MWTIRLLLTVSQGCNDHISSILTYDFQVPKVCISVVCWGFPLFFAKSTPGGNSSFPYCFASNHIFKSIASLIKLNFNISWFHLVSVYNLLLASHVFPNFLSLLVSLHLMLCLILIIVLKKYHKVKKCSNVYFISSDHRPSLVEGMNSKMSGHMMAVSPTKVKTMGPTNTV
jgi:hypothetical protein